MRDARDSYQEREEKGKVMLASVVHDLKTPLQVISGYAESLEDGMTDKNYCALILQKTAEMNTQVLSLVESSKREIQTIGERKQRLLMSECCRNQSEK